MLTFIMLLWWESVGSSVESIPYQQNLEPGTCSERIHYAIRSPTAASLTVHVKLASHLIRISKYHMRHDVIIMIYMFGIALVEDNVRRKQDLHVSSY